MSYYHYYDYYYYTYIYIHIFIHASVSDGDSVCLLRQLEGGQDRPIEETMRQHVDCARRMVAGRRPAPRATPSSSTQLSSPSRAHSYLPLLPDPREHSHPRPTPRLLQTASSATHSTQFRLSRVTRGVECNATREVACIANNHVVTTTSMILTRSRHHQNPRFSQRV